MKYLAPLVLLLALTGCGSSSAPSSSPSSTDSAASEPAVQPCDGLDANAVATVLGSGLTVSKGTADDPECALLPKRKGDPVFRLNYQWWFKGGLDAAFQAMHAGKGQVSDIKVPGADAAKLVVQATPKMLFISGFVENDNLIQLVNGEALAPYSKARMLAATKLVLGQLSKSAPASQG